MAPKTIAELVSHELDILAEYEMNGLVPSSIHMVRPRLNTSAASKALG